MSESRFGANTLRCEWFLSMALAVMFYLVPFQFCFTVIVLLGVRLESRKNDTQVVRHFPWQAHRPECNVGLVRSESICMAQ